MMDKRLKDLLSKQIGELAAITSEQGILIQDLRDALTGKDATIAELKAQVAELELNLAEARQQQLPLGDALPGHEGEANGAAHH